MHVEKEKLAMLAFALGISRVDKSTNTSQRQGKYVGSNDT
jgi:hypothetical protein